MGLHFICTCYPWASRLLEHFYFDYFKQSYWRAILSPLKHIKIIIVYVLICHAWMWDVGKRWFDLVKLKWQMMIRKSSNEFLLILLLFGLNIVMKIYIYHKQNQQTVSLTPVRGNRIIQISQMAGSYGFYAEALGVSILSGKTSYHQISWSLEVARLDVMLIVSLWNLTDISAALLPRCLSNLRAIGKV